MGVLVIQMGVLGIPEQEKALLVDLLCRLELRAADIKKAHQ